MLNIQDRIDLYLMEADGWLPGMEPPPKTRGATSRVSGQPGQSTWKVQSPTPQPAYQPAQEKIPITDEQMAERIANDVLNEVRPKLHDITEKLRQTIFQIRPDLGQMISQGWGKLKDFWRNWTGGTKESLEAYKILSEYITKLYEEDLPRAQAAQGTTPYNYNVARSTQFPRPGQLGPQWQPSQYSVHDTLAMFLQRVEGLLYESIKKNVLIELRKRPSAASYSFNQNVAMATKQKAMAMQQKVRNQIDNVKVKHDQIKNRLTRQQQELEKRIQYEKSLKSRLKQHGEKTGDYEIVPKDELEAKECPGCMPEDQLKQSFDAVAADLKQIEDMEIKNLEDIFGSMHLDEVKPVPPVM